ncbi:MAG: response regulator transcription factor [Pseudonocardiaceae bacterium]
MYRTTGFHLGFGFAALAQSHAATVAGDSASAARYARDAVTAFERAGTPIETARAELIAGRALAAADRREDALAYLDRAREHSADTGARGLHNEITRELRRLGLRRSSRPVQSAAGPTLEILSPREHEIAVLVARGWTNRAIASTLFLSVKTVERHLCHTFAKLDISSCAALAALIATHAATLSRLT